MHPHSAARRFLGGAAGEARAARPGITGNEDLRIRGHLPGSQSLLLGKIAYAEREEPFRAGRHRCEEAGQGRCPRAFNAGEVGQVVRGGLAGGDDPLDEAASPRPQGLHRSQRLVAQQHPPRDRGQIGGARGADEVDGIGLLHHPQARTDPHVRANVRGHRAAGPLRGEHDVNPERATLGGHPHEFVEHVGVFIGEYAELVDDDEQPGQRLREGVVLGHVRGPRFLQQPLPAENFHAQAP